MSETVFGLPGGGKTTSALHLHAAVAARALLSGGPLYVLDGKDPRPPQTPLLWRRELDLPALLERVFTRPRRIRVGDHVLDRRTGRRGRVRTVARREQVAFVELAGQYSPVLRHPWQMVFITRDGRA